MTSLRRLALLAVVLLAAIGLGGCSADDGRTTITVSLRSSACLKVQAKCYELGLPEARVEVVDGGDGPLASGATDGAGNVTLTPSETGSVRIVVTSPLFVGGRKEVDVLIVPGSKTDQTIWVDLAVSELAQQ